MNKVNKSLISAVSSVLKAACCAGASGRGFDPVYRLLGFRVLIHRYALDTHPAAALAMIPVTVQAIVIQG